ncbi:hypothetical protein [Nostoc sp. DSM 114159]|jgi:hypothetical protein
MHKAYSYFAENSCKKLGYAIALFYQIPTYTTPINNCNTSLVEDAIHRVSTNDLFVALFYQIPTYSYNGDLSHDC